MTISVGVVCFQHIVYRRLACMLVSWYNQSVFLSIWSSFFLPVKRGLLKSEEGWRGWKGRTREKNDTEADIEGYTCDKWPEDERIRWLCACVSWCWVFEWSTLTSDISLGSLKKKQRIGCASNSREGHKRPPKALDKPTKKRKENI